MKCVVIHGSPRRGNSWNVLTLVKEEMRKKFRDRVYRYRA